MFVDVKNRIPYLLFKNKKPFSSNKKFWFLNETLLDLLRHNKKEKLFHASIILEESIFYDTSVQLIKDYTLYDNVIFIPYDLRKLNG